MRKFTTTELNPCVCGFKPTYFSLGYSRTPYDVFCPNCNKQTQFAKCKVTGHPDGVIDYWNEHISKLTKKEMEKEIKGLIKEKKKVDPYNEYKVYDYYWVQGKGEVLDKRCY